MPLLLDCVGHLLDKREIFPGTGFSVSFVTEPPLDCPSAPVLSFLRR
jgi:hypothetical protein